MKIQIEISEACLKNLKELFYYQNTDFNKDNIRKDIQEAVDHYLVGLKIELNNLSKDFNENLAGKTT